MSKANHIIESCLLGMAVGDSMGLPMEGMSREKISKLGWMSKPRQRLILGQGLVSDDTEHAMMTLSAMINSGGDVAKFDRSLRWKLRWWVIGLPAGVGLATAKSCFKMWLGVKRSGVFSAGNGPAMRSVMIGAMYSHDEVKRRAYVEHSTLMTHSDPKALIGANVVAELAALFASAENIPSSEMIHQLVRKEGMPDSAMETCSSACQNGVSGYMYHTVPALINVGVQFDWNYEKCIKKIIKLGGDTDTTAAILGGLCGIVAVNNTTEIPKDWVSSIIEFPRSVSAMQRLANSDKHRVSLWFAPAQVLRNLLFLFVVLGHGLMRPFMGILKAKG